MSAISPAALAEIQAFFTKCNTWEAASTFILKVKASHNRWLALSYSHLIKEVGACLGRAPMTLTIAQERDEVFEWLATGLEVKIPTVGSQEVPFALGVQMGGFRCTPDDQVISFGSVQKGAWEKQAMLRAMEAMDCWSRGVTCTPAKAKAVRADKKRKQASSSSDTCDEAHVAPAVRMTRREAADAYLSHSTKAAQSLYAFMLADIDE